MTFYGTRGDQDKAIAERIAAHREAAEMTVKCKPIIQHFNSKCYNCRLDKALKDAGRVYAKKYEKYIEIYCYTGAHGYSCNFTLARLPIDKFTTDGKRINAGAVIDELNDRRADHLKRAAEIEEAAAHIDETLVRMDAAKRVIDGIRESLPYAVRDIYNLNVYTRS